MASRNIRRSPFGFAASSSSARISRVSFTVAPPPLRLAHSTLGTSETGTPSTSEGTCAGTSRTARTDRSCLPRRLGLPPSRTRFRRILPPEGNRCQGKAAGWRCPKRTCELTDTREWKLGHSPLQIRTLRLKPGHYQPLRFAVREPQQCARLRTHAGYPRDGRVSFRGQTD